MLLCLSPSPARRGRVGVGGNGRETLERAPLPTSPRSLREQGEETSSATLEI